MAYSKMPLSDETINELEIVDHHQKHFQGKDLEQDNLMVTREGVQIISIKPSFHNSLGIEKGERIIAIRNESESRVETHKISTVKELADILNADLGLSIFYQSHEI